MPLAALGPFGGRFAGYAVADKAGFQIRTLPRMLIIDGFLTVVRRADVD